MLSMSRKKVFLLAVSLVLMMSLFSNVVSAQEDEGGLGSAFDTIRKLFAFLPELITMEKLLDADPVAIFWAKFLIWLGLFAVIYFGASFPLKQNPRIAVIVALVISLMSALMIPNATIGSIFQTYGLLAAIIVWAVPVIAGFYLAHMLGNKNRLIKAFIYLLVLIVLTLINGNTLVKDIWNIALPYFMLLWAVVLLLFLYNLFAGLGDLGIGGGGGGGGGGFRFPRWGDVTHGANAELEDAARGGRGLFGRRREPRTPEEEQRLVDEAQRVRESIEALEEQLRKKLKTADERQLLIELAELINQLDPVQKELIRLERI